MSSFKRKGSAKQPARLAGTKSSPASSLTTITSTGIPSLDDILGGGLPLSCSLLILAPDIYSSYGELVQKYFISEGLACKQRVFVVHENGRDFVRSCMWQSASTSSATEGDDIASQNDGSKIKIAWRYEQMKQFQTTTSSISSAEEFCHSFDLTTQIPDQTIESAVKASQLSFLEPEGPSSTSGILKQLEELLLESNQTPVRICIPSLGSPSWDDLTSQELLYFLHSVRALLRRFPLACASISLAPTIASDTWGGLGWVQRLGWVTDGAITLSAFTGNPSMVATFPSYHGVVHIQRLPSPHTLVSPSDRFSTLRGLSSGGSGENNLAFKCTRKRLIFETLHLDLDGGVSERRTTPATTATFEEPDRKNTGLASVKVELEGENVEPAGNSNSSSEKKKTKRKVAFQSDRPDIYDF